jgi:hypothetical protein
MGAQFMCGHCFEKREAKGNAGSRAAVPSSGSGAASQQQPKAGVPGNADASHGALAETCAACSKPLGHSDGVRLTNDTVVHISCLTCGVCEEPIASGVFKRRDGKGFHPKCHDAAFGAAQQPTAGQQRCGKCSAAITGSFSKIDGVVMCRACLVCAKVGVFGFLFGFGVWKKNKKKIHPLFFTKKKKKKKKMEVQGLARRRIRQGGWRAQLRRLRVQAAVRRRGANRPADQGFRRRPRDGAEADRRVSCK